MTFVLQTRDISCHRKVERIMLRQVDCVRQALRTHRGLRARARFRATGALEYRSAGVLQFCSNAPCLNCTPRLRS